MTETGKFGQKTITYSSVSSPNLNNALGAGARVLAIYGKGTAFTATLTLAGSIPLCATTEASDPNYVQFPVPIPTRLQSKNSTTLADLTLVLSVMTAAVVTVVYTLDRN